jgi:external thioesterase TEII
MKLSGKFQLFMLHFAGGNTYSFQFLKPYLPVNFEVHSLELPGRGKRIKEKFLTTELEAVEDLFLQINSLRNNLPYLVYGHSMGAILGLKVVKRLEEQGDPPKRLVVSGNPGPGIGEKKYRSKFPDEEFKKELQVLGGVPDEVLNNDELFNFFSPIMRSDFSLFEDSHEVETNFRIKTPLIAVMGNEEEYADKIGNWNNFTSNEFKFHLFRGNHFFIHDHPFDLVKVISNSYDTHGQQ